MVCPANFVLMYLKRGPILKWKNTLKNRLQIRTEILWNRKNITIDARSTFSKDWHRVGITKVKDILSSSNEFIAYQELISRFGRALILLSNCRGLSMPFLSDWKRYGRPLPPKIQEFQMVRTKYSWFMFSFILFYSSKESCSVTGERNLL